MTTKEPESNERWTMSVPFTMGQELTIQSTQSTRIGNYKDAEQKELKGKGTVQTVSYTHLTLPTIE